MEIVTDLIFLGSKITANGDCSHEIETLAPWEKSCDQPRQCIKKAETLLLPTKVCLVKAMVFPVVMYGCESWTIKKAERQRTHTFELWCWRRLLRVSWTARKSTLNIHWKGWSWNSSTLATWWKELTHWKRPWYWERLRAGEEGDDIGWNDGHEVEQALGVGDGQGILARCSPWSHKELDTTERLNNKPRTQWYFVTAASTVSDTQKNRKLLI